jgi:putative transcriptional regulator
MTIGHNIRERRWDARLNQAELARRVGVTRNAINRIELGYNNPSVGTLKKIADVLGVSVDELYEGPDLKADAPEAPKGEGPGLLEEVVSALRDPKRLDARVVVDGLEPGGLYPPRGVSVDSWILSFILRHEPDVVARALLEAAKILNDVRTKSGRSQEDPKRFFEMLTKTLGGEHQGTPS